MKTETDQRELSPAELWDQLAVSMIKKQLAPNGYKKVYRGKSEVSNIQFLGKATVNQTCVIGANLVRLYRENLREELNGRIKAAEAERDKAIKDRNACRIWQFRMKRNFQKVYEHYRDKAGLLKIIQWQLDFIKPSTPKQPKKK